MTLISAIVQNQNLAGLGRLSFDDKSSCAQEAADGLYTDGGGKLELGLVFKHRPNATGSGLNLTMMYGLCEREFSIWS